MSFESRLLCRWPSMVGRAGVEVIWRRPHKLLEQEASLRKG